MSIPLETMVLQRVGDMGQESVAAAIGKNRSSVSRFTSNDVALRLNEIEAFLLALGLQVTPADQLHIDVDEYERLLDIAARYYADRKAAVRGAK